MVTGQPGVCGSPVPSCSFSLSTVSSVEASQQVQTPGKREVINLLLLEGYVHKLCLIPLKEQLTLLPSLLPFYTHIYLCPYGLMYLLHPLGCNPMLCFLFCCYGCSSLAVAIFHTGICVLLTCPIDFFLVLP